MPNPENILPHKFKKGQSGNPKGRPKGAQNRSTKAKYWLYVKQEAKNPLTGEQEIMDQEDFITLGQVLKARKGDTAAYKALMDSAYGTQMSVEIEETNDIIVNVSF